MSYSLDDVRTVRTGRRVVAMPKTYVRLVKDARYRWLAFVKFTGRNARRKVWSAGRVLTVANPEMPVACRPMIVGEDILRLSAAAVPRGRDPAAPLTAAAYIVTDGSKWTETGGCQTVCRSLRRWRPRRACGSASRRPRAASPLTHDLADVGGRAIGVFLGPYRIGRWPAQ